MTTIERVLSGAIPWAEFMRMVHFNPFIPEGMGFRMDGKFVYRHPSEFFLQLSGARWHVWRGHCPTWSDATECRCMLGGEA